jgi:biotin carboxyl carrier protein
MKYTTTIDGKEFSVDVIDEKHVQINDQIIEVDFEAVSGQPVYSLIIGGRSYEAYIYPDDKEWQVLLHGRLYQASVEDEREQRLRAAGTKVVLTGEFQLKAPMPGLVVSVLVEEGQAVKQGQVLLVLESMKMQNELKAPRDGTIAKVRVKPGDTVEQKQLMLSLM